MFALLSIILPIILGTLLLSRGWKKNYRLHSILISLLVLVISSIGYINGNIEHYTWMPSIGVMASFHIDGIGYIIGLATLLVFILTQIGVWKNKFLSSGYENGLSLIMLGSLLGVFFSLDLIVYYVFLEITLVASFFLPFIHRGKKREQACIKYFILNHVGSLVFLVSILMIYLAAGTSYMPDLLNLTQNSNLMLAGWLALFAFMLKSAIFPLSIWLPDFYKQSPTPITAIIAGTVTNLGAFGLIRYAQYLPNDILNSNVIALFAIGTLFYGGILALTQKDIVKMFAYSTVSQMGYIFLGIASQLEPTSSTINLNILNIGLIGAIFYLFAHSIAKSFLFTAVSQYPENQTDIDDLKGSGYHIPLPALGFLIGGFTLMGLPPLAGFMGEWMIFAGAFPAFGTLSTIGVFGIILSNAYFAWLMYRLYIPQADVKTRVKSELTFNSFSKKFKGLVVYCNELFA